MLIAILEDEEDLLELIEFNLKKEGFDVVGFLNSKRFKDFIYEESPDLLIVDRNLPFVEGAIFVRSLREEGVDIPVIFISAKVSEDEVLEGFRSGGDDYIKKPFSIKELVARVKAVLRRYDKELRVKVYKNMVLDLNNSTLKVKDKIYSLTPNELKLLELFFNKKGVVSKDEIADSFGIGVGSVNVFISRLNHKVDILKAIRGVGYRIKDEI